MDVSGRDIALMVAIALVVILIAGCVSSVTDAKADVGTQRFRGEYAANVGWSDVYLLTDSETGREFIVVFGRYHGEPAVEEIGGNE